MKITVIGLSLCAVLTATVTQCADRPAAWSSFRNGGSSRVAGDLPVSWSASASIAWERETDGYGQSTPIIADDTIYTISVLGTQKEQSAVSAYALSTGERLWQYRFDSSTQGPSNYMYSRGAPTPVADEAGVYGFFEAGDLVAVRTNGECLWKRNLAEEFGPFESNHGLGASLAQSNDLLLLNIEHKGPSKLIAVRKRDGYVAWQADRPSGSSWTSPVVTDDAVIVCSAGELAAYALADGERQWAVEGLEGNSVPSPCVIDGRVYTGARIPEFGSAAEAARSNICVEIPKSKDDEARVLWRSRGAVCDYASPVVDENRVYFLNKVGVLSCVDADTGAPLFRTRLGTECWATPVIADNGIYFFGRNGQTKVIARGPEFKVLQTNQLWSLETPPQPESYREAERTSHGHGAAATAGGPGHGKSEASSQAGGLPGGPPAGGKTEAGKPTAGGRPGSGMIAAMMSRDANKDGILQADEMSPDFRPMLKRVDKNGDGALNAAELKAMADSFAERRKNSRASSRDPIVYGVAAVPGALVIRTGTRLYCVTASAADQKTTGGEQ
ncbi:MAG: PQQ-binding-like beta-propeller repeat protein [Planctomycetaceae bacterium]|nr:PQQ-binding-like beta-propeller repeat protein [Planctomycetaceae bacterium]